MSESGEQGKNKLIAETLDRLVSQSQHHTQITRKRPEELKTNDNGITRDLARALTVLLVDLATCDQSFKQEEYHRIAACLQELFGSTRDEIKEYVNEAQTALANLRGTERQTALLKKHLTPEQKETVMAMIDEMISADGVENGFKSYRRNKFAEKLGLDLGLDSKK